MQGKDIRGICEISCGRIWNLRNVYHFRFEQEIQCHISPNQLALYQDKS